MLTDVGPVAVTVPRDREGRFEPKIVAKLQKRLTGVDEMVISLSAKGLTTGEVQAHLAEVYGAEASRQTISTLPRQGGRGHGRMAEPAPGPGVPGDRHRRDQRQDPRREGRQPADLRLTWRDLVGWWNEQHPGRGTERDAARELYNRLVKSLGDNPVEKILFRTYAEFYGHPDGFDLPALIPQVYLHYDPYTKRQLGDRPGQLDRQRMDFLLLMSRRQRVVLEVDGRQHYAELNGTADPIRYSKMVPKTAR